MKTNDNLTKEKYSLKISRNQTESDQLYSKLMNKHIQESKGTFIDKLNNFPRFVSRQSLSLFLAKNEIFRRTIDIHGSIIEAGVFMGGGLFTWAHLSAIYEPINYNRKIIGFDSFQGFPEIAKEDQVRNNVHLKEGGYKFECYEELRKSAEIHDLTRPIGHIAKIELIKGNADITIPKYISENAHLVVSLLYLDFDLYEPTKLAIKHFLPRIPRGGVIAFDELNQSNWPGETMAVLEEVGLNNIKLERVPYTPSLSFAVLA